MRGSLFCMLQIDVSRAAVVRTGGGTIQMLTNEDSTFLHAA